MNNLFKKYEQPLKGGTLNLSLIKIRGHQCERCKNTEWLGQPITLQVHHKDGDRCNNELNNLELLCPNCHSYTDNFCGKKHKDKVSDEILINNIKNSPSIRQALLKSNLGDHGVNYERVKILIEEHNIQVGENLPKKEIRTCKRCGKPVTSNANYCPACYNFLMRKVERPEREELKKLIRTTPFTTIATKFGVTDNAIRKWCDFYNLPRRVSDIKNISDKEWEEI